MCYFIIYIYICIPIYIYIYTWRERERERCMYIYIYICISFANACIMITITTGVCERQFQRRRRHLGRQVVRALQSFHLTVCTMFQCHISGFSKLYQKQLNNASNIKPNERIANWQLKTPSPDPSLLVIA